MAVYDDGAGSLLYDQDTMLPFPCQFHVYADKALRSDDHIVPDYHR